MVHFVTVTLKIWLFSMGLMLLLINNSRCNVLLNSAPIRPENRKNVNKYQEILDQNKELQTPFNSLRGYSNNEYLRDKGRMKKRNDVVKRRKREYIPKYGPLITRSPPKLPDGVERLYEKSEYLSSDSVSFYSHEDTPSEIKMCYGASSSLSYEIETDPPPTKIKPDEMVQILLTKSIDPYIAYKSVAADFEVKPRYRKVVWDRLYLHSISVYRALMMFKITKEEIYKLLKKAHEQKLFTAPPKDTWKTLHDYDEAIVPDLNPGHLMWWTRTTPKQVRTRGTVSVKDKAIIEKFKTTSRDIARTLRNCTIDYHIAFEILKAEKRMSHVEFKMLIKKFEMSPRDIYNALSHHNLTEEDIYRSLKYLSETLELFRKPLGSGPHNDGALHKQLYAQNLVLFSEEDLDVLEKYLMPNFAKEKPPVITPYTKPKSNT